jgi:hypothetical protein
VLFCNDYLFAASGFDFRISILNSFCSGSFDKNYFISVVSLVPHCPEGKEMNAFVNIQM